MIIDQCPNLRQNARRSFSTSCIELTLAHEMWISHCEFIHQIHYIRFRNHQCPFFVQCIKHWSFCGEVQLHQQLQKLNPCIPYDIDTIDFVWKSSLTQRFKKNGSKFQVTFYTATQWINWVSRKCRNVIIKISILVKRPKQIERSSLRNCWDPGSSGGGSPGSEPMILSTIQQGIRQKWNMNPEYIY